MFAHSGDEAYRDVHRTTWMTGLPFVCNPNAEILDDKCKVGLVFVVAESDKCDQNNNDCLLVPIVEKYPPKDKTVSFFFHAPKKYPWADYFVHADLDIYPHFPQIFTKVSQVRGEYAILGVPLGHDECGRNSYCPPKNCGYAIDSNFMKYQSGERHCWSYMSGGFIVLSSSLAKGVFQQDAGPWPSFDFTDWDDVAVGYVVHEFGVKRKTDVYTDFLYGGAFDHFR